jgi:hypothetical protein
MADLSRIIAPSPDEMEAFKAACQRLGVAVATAGRAALAAAYPWHGKPPTWLPLTPARRPDPTIGRKRRARRARGRRIEARRNTPYVGGRIWLASARLGFKSFPLPRVMMLDEIDSFDLLKFTEEQARAEIAARTERWRKLINPLMGKPWEEQADD